MTTEVVVVTTTNTVVTENTETNVVEVTASGTTPTVEIIAEGPAGPPGGQVTVQDEGVTVGTLDDKLNFVGSMVGVTNNPTTETITVTVTAPSPTVSLTGAVTGSGTMTNLGNVSIATTATADPTLTLAGDATGTATFTNLGDATLTVTVVDDSHNHIISNVDGLQDALDLKAPLASPTFTGTVTLPSTTSVGTVSATEIGYLDGVTSGIQAQIDSKLPSASYTAADVLDKIKTVDGSGSGLDADLLDGESGAYYLDFTNATNKPDPTITLSGDATGSVTLTDLASGTLSVTVVDDSHNHVISNVDGLQDALDSKLAAADYNAADVLTKIKTVDGAGSGLDADLLDGQSSAYYTVSLTGGAGISTSGTHPNFTITNSAPDQTVVLTAGTGISTSGTYPNFTITNSAPDQTVALTGSGTTSISGTYPNFTISSADQYVGTVTSVALSGGTTGLTVTGSPITSSGTLTLGGTLALASGGTGATTAADARTNLGLGTAATTDASAYATAAQGAKADTAVQTITSADGSVTITGTTAIDLSVVKATNASNLLVPVRNATGATLTKGTAVYINGAIGQISTVTKALATGDSTSAQTLGLIAADLPNNTNGNVILIGTLTGVNTAAYSDGQQLYLSPSVAGGLTATKPYAPDHLVYIAVVEYAHAVQGKLFVKVQNGYELDELHDVAAQSPTNGQTLVYNSTSDLWEKNTVSLTAGVNGTLPVANGGTGATTAPNARVSLGAAASGANTDLTSVALTTGTISTTPTAGTDIVNKNYADSIAAGINFHQSVRLASAAALPAYTYNNGTAGVGATITGNANGALSLDGVAVAASDRVLIKNETSTAAPYNGVYVVTRAGNGSTTFLLTRSADFNTAGSGVNQIDAGDFFLVTAGSTQANTSWVQQTALPITLGTTALVFTQFGAPITYSAGTGLTLGGTVFSITNTGVTANSYGSASSVPVIAVNAQGQITSASSSSIAIAASQITSGSLPIANGGTGATTAAGALSNLGAYAASNPAGYTTNVGTVTSVSGTGTVSGLTLTGSVTSSGSLTLGGTLSLTSANVTDALGYTPYNATNPSGYITGITSGNVTTALGYTPANKAGDSFTGTVSSSADFRAPIFYDSANTAFYLDPNAALSLNTYGSLQINGYANANSYVSFNNAGVYWGLIGNYGTDDFRLGWGSWQTMLNWSGRWDSSGNFFGNSSLRAPIFYDTDNTGYYLDPAGSSNLATVNFNGTASINNGNPLFIRAANGAYQRVDSRNEDTTVSRAHWYGVDSSGGTSNFRHAWYDGAAYFQVTASSSQILFERTVGTTSVVSAGDLRSTIYYDSNNTGYYIDPNAPTSLRTVGDWRSDSSAWTGEFNGKIQYHSSNWYFQAAGNWEFRRSDSANAFSVTQAGSAFFAGAINTINGYTPANSAIRLTPNLHLNATAGNAVILNWDNGTTAGLTLRIGNGAGSDVFTVYANGATYAPIYYDINDSAYYVDPASTSRINQINYTTLYNASDTNYGVVGANGFFDTVNSGVDADALELCYVRGSEVRIGTGGGNKAIRASIFYEGTNTAYYVDPDGSTSLRTVGDWRSDSGAWTGEFSGKIQYHANNWYFQAAAEWNFRRSDAQHAFSVTQAGIASVLGDMRAPIFYDSNNTGYYFDGASTTNINQLNGNGKTIFETGDGYLRINQSASFVSGCWFGGSNVGMANATLHIGSNGDPGVSRIRLIGGSYNGQTVLTLDGTSGVGTAFDSWRAPIFYDSADTGFYLNLNGYSQHYGYGNTGSASGTGFNVMGNPSNGAIMAFHRAAAYAINMGLDTDNVFRLGGWSAAANRLQMDMSGNLTMAGNVTAYSDIRLKENIATVTDALALVGQMRGVTYNRRDTGKAGVGVIAQEMLEVLPQVVQQGVGDDDTLSVAYGNIVGVLIEAIKELENKVKALEVKE